MTDRIRSLLGQVYSGDELRIAVEQIEALFSARAASDSRDGTRAALSQRDALLISYPDAIRSGGEAPLATLRRFCGNHLKDALSGVHILPHYPFTSDDGFSVVDYHRVDPEHGSWDDVRALGQDFDLMLDAVINHMSVSSEWFKAYLRGEKPYDGFFIEAVEGADYSKVVRPRALPLFTEFQTSRGVRGVWTTFSEDQADLNVMNPEVLARLTEVLIFYADQGAKFIRLDAVGFLWKQPGESCMNMPQTHALIKVMREVLSACRPGVRLITETNVPHAENIAYFGDADEADLVYNFALPPLTLHTFAAGDSARLCDWLRSLEPAPAGCAYFNFLSSHDGIGLRPIESMLSDAEQQALVERCLANGGALGMRVLPDGSQKVYELNINYLDAISRPEWDDQMRARCTLAAHAILLSLPGVPAIYYHTLLGSRNDRAGMLESGINRRINREKLDYDRLVSELATDGSLRQLVFDGMRRLLSVRRSCEAFAPDSGMSVIDMGPRVVAIQRGHGVDAVTCAVNISEAPVAVRIGNPGFDLIGDARVEAGERELAAYEVLWIQHGDKGRALS